MLEDHIYDRIAELLRESKKTSKLLGLWGNLKDSDDKFIPKDQIPRLDPESRRKTDKLYLTLHGLAHEVKALCEAYQKYDPTNAVVNKALVDANNACAQLKDGLCSILQSMYKKLKS